MKEASQDHIDHKSSQVGWQFSLEDGVSFSDPEGIFKNT